MCLVWSIMVQHVQWRIATVGTWILPPGSPSHKHHSSQATWHHGWAPGGGHNTHTHTRNVYATMRYNPSAFLLVDTYYKHMDHSLWMIGRFQSWHSALLGLNIFWRSPAAFPPWMSSPRGFPALAGEGMGLHFNSSITRYHQYLTPIWIQSWGVRGVWIMMDYDLEHGILI